MKKWLIALLVLVVILAGAGAYRVYKIRTQTLALSIDTIQLEEGLPVRVFRAER